jgi:hypothetical protein
MSRRKLKLVLLGTMAIGALGSIAVPGVYAVYVAETRNTQATVSSGTLTMDLVVNGGSPCYSYLGPASPGNVNTNCDSLVTFSSSAEMYPGEPVTIPVTLRNDGSLAASDLAVYMPGGCTKAATTGASSPGTGDPCAAGGMQFYIQETTASGPKCWFPAAAGACSFTSDLSSFAARTTLGLSLDLGAGPAAQQTRTFTIGLQEPINASNTLQGQAATFALAWHLTS